MWTIALPFHTAKPSRPTERKSALLSPRLAFVLLAVSLIARPAAAQQRPLVTEDPEPIGAGRILVEGGVDHAREQSYPVSGLKGNLWRIPMVGISVGISSIAELQIDGGFYDRLDITERRSAPLSGAVTAGDTTHAVADIVVGTKIRLVGEGAGRPALAVRFATKLPQASNESGLGTDTIDFYASALGAKTVESVRIVGNIGVGILSDPTQGDRQNDVLTYGLSFARAVTQRAEFVGEFNGRVSTRSGDPFPGTETRGALRLGARYTYNSVRLDAGLGIGLTSRDPSVGFTAGFTYVFNAFTLP
jgi:hypothetical protein